MQNLTAREMFVIGILITTGFSAMAEKPREHSQPQAAVSVPATGYTSEQTHAIQTLKDLTSQREGRAAALKEGQTITIDTFKEVCAPVGVQLKAWATKMGYQVQQITRKNRNPLHALPSDDEAAYTKFEKDAKLENLVDHGVLYQRISVTKGCLHCHGDEKSRPQFIKEKYPNDHAFDFKIGDLRGLYRVVIPQTK